MVGIAIISGVAEVVRAYFTRLSRSKIIAIIQIVVFLVGAAGLAGLGMRSCRNALKRRQERVDCSGSGPRRSSAPKKRRTIGQGRRLKSAYGNTPRMLPGSRSGEIGQALRRSAARKPRLRAGWSRRRRRSTVATKSRSRILLPMSCASPSRKLAQRHRQGHPDLPLRT